jgi:PAS domain S-box-containing protein
MRDGRDSSTPGAVLGGEDEILRLIVDSATDYAILTTDSDNRILTWSAGAEAIFGYTPEEAIGQSGALIFTAEDRAAGAPEQEIETARRTGCAPDERWHVRKDGSLVFMNGSMRPLLDGGRERGFLKVARDETATRRTATALEASEARFRALADNIAQLAWITDQDGAIIWYNRRWYDYTGTTFDQMQGWGWRAVHHPDHVERVVERFSRALAACEAWEDTFPLRGRDGAYRWFLSRAQPIYDEAGALTGWFGTNTDITELRDTAAALRESEEHYRSTVERNPQVSWTSLPDGQLDRVSQRWLDWTGTSGLGATWGEVIHPDDLQRTVDVWTRSVATGEPYDIEHRVRLRSGDYHWMRSRASARTDEQGRVVKWYGTTEDIHEQKAAEAALRESEMRLRAITDSIDQMIWSTRPDGHHDYFNQRWYDYTGMSGGSTDIPV